MSRSGEIIRLCVRAEASIMKNRILLILADVRETRFVFEGIGRLFVTQKKGRGVDVVTNCGD